MPIKQNTENACQKREEKKPKATKDAAGKTRKQKYVQKDKKCR